MPFAIKTFFPIYPYQQFPIQVQHLQVFILAIQCINSGLPQRRSNTSTWTSTKGYKIILKWHPRRVSFFIAVSHLLPQMV